MYGPSEDLMAPSAPEEKPEETQEEITEAPEAPEETIEEAPAPELTAGMIRRAARRKANAEAKAKD